MKKQTAVDQNHSKCVWKHKIIIPKEEAKTGYVKSKTEFLGVEFTLKDGSKQFVPKQETLEENETYGGDE
jgi:hypothetical protein